MKLSGLFRFWRQAPTKRPPKGYYDLRVSKATGKLVLVDSDGTEYTFAQTSQTDGTITSADIADASTGETAAAPSKVIKFSATGDANVHDGYFIGRDRNSEVVAQLGASAVNDGELVLKKSGATYQWSMRSDTLTNNRTVLAVDMTGYNAVAPKYDDETAANAAEAANVLYYNAATGKFQITTA